MCMCTVEVCVLSICICIRLEYVYIHINGTVEVGNTEHTFTSGTILKIVPDSFLGFLLYESPYELWYF